MSFYFFFPIMQVSTFVLNRFSSIQFYFTVFYHFPIIPFLRFFPIKKRFYFFKFAVFFASDDEFYRFFFKIFHCSCRLQSSIYHVNIIMMLFFFHLFKNGLRKRSFL